MLNRCPTSSYDQVCQVVKKELGGAPEEVCVPTVFILFNTEYSFSYLIMPLLLF